MRNNIREHNLGARGLISLGQSFLLNLFVDKAKKMFSFLKKDIIIINSYWHFKLKFGTTVFFLKLIDFTILSPCNFAKNFGSQ